MQYVKRLHRYGLKNQDRVPFLLGMIIILSCLIALNDLVASAGFLLKGTSSQFSRALRDLRAKHIDLKELVSQAKSEAQGRARTCGLMTFYSIRASAAYSDKGQWP